MHACIPSVVPFLDSGCTMASHWQAGIQTKDPKLACINDVNVLRPGVQPSQPFGVAAVPCLVWPKIEADALHIAC